MVQEVDLNSVTIRIVPPLKKVRLVDVLDAIVRVADRPIQYTVEGYAVVFTLDGSRINSMNLGMPVPPPPVAPARPALQTRAFKVDTNAFFRGLEQMFFHTPLPVGAADTGDALRLGVFPRIGVELKSPSFVLYNPITGMLLIRARQEDMEGIQAVLESLGGTPSATTESSAVGSGEGGWGILSQSARKRGAGRAEETPASKP